MSIIVAGTPPFAWRLDNLTLSSLRLLSPPLPQTLALGHSMGLEG